ncbi:MAG: phosphate signaling complex protein PhoU [Desulfovibrio sp.]|jgi:phosphate transport system protein|nr:phosphate signaling complex protein PhoU [Desulfovibrio sp.]
MKETQLQQGIGRLRTRLLVMCAAVGIAVDDACAAAAAGDMRLARAVVDGDGVIDALENEIDEAALTLLVRRQPAGQDLRFVAAAQRIVIDLERIGDEAAAIAERALSMQGPLPGPVWESIKVPADAAVSLYKKAVEAFRVGDTCSALELWRNEEESARLEAQALRGIMDYFALDGNNIGLSYAGMHGVLICRSLNRICRRAANMAEHTYFIVKGVNLKHVFPLTAMPDEIHVDGE